MTRKRKTFSVEEAKTKANEWLARDVSQEEKRGVCFLIENILHRTGNYKGFSYNYWDEKGFKDWLDAGEPDFPEKSKYIGPEYSRHYY